MNGPRNPRAPRQNWILAALPAAERARLDPLLEPVHLTPPEVLYRPDEPIAHAWFVLDGVVSLVTRPLEDGRVLEIATVGNEGVVGVPLFLGATSVPVRAMCQIEGDALRMPAGAFRRESAAPGAFRDLLHLYVQALFNQIAQAGACNRAHNVEQRACRWLLMTHDRVGRDSFVLTQEFLSQMLGVRRASVNAVMKHLQDERCVTYRRGLITIVDRAGLERVACACYAIIRDELDRLLPP